MRRVLLAKHWSVSSTSGCHASVPTLNYSEWAVTLRADTLGNKVPSWLKEYITSLVWREIDSQGIALFRPPRSGVLVHVVYHTPANPSRETGL